MPADSVRKDVAQALREHAGIHRRHEAERTRLVDLHGLTRYRRDHEPALLKKADDELAAWADRWKHRMTEIKREHEDVTWNAPNYLARLPRLKSTRDAMDERDDAGRRAR